MRSFRMLVLFIGGLLSASFACAGDGAVRFETPAAFSILPLSAGFELRAHAEVLQYDDAGQLVSRVEVQRGPVQVSREHPSIRWVHALPAQAGFDAVALTPPSNWRPDDTRLCERLTLEDGRRLMRVSALPPLRVETLQISPPWPPTLPGGSLSRVNGHLDDAYLQAAVARDSRGDVHAFALGGGGSSGYRVITFAPDCEPLGELVDPRSFDAHPEHPGAYVLQGDSFPRSGGRRLLRRVGAETLWSVELDPLLGIEFPHAVSYWVWALADGGALVAGMNIPDGEPRLELARFNVEGQLQARAAIQGLAVAAFREQGGSLLLAVADSQTSLQPMVGAGTLVELGQDLAERQRVTLESVFVHGVMNTAESGLRSDLWLVSDSPRVLRAIDAEMPAPAAYGVLRVLPGLRLEWLQTPQPERPRMVLAGGDLLSSTIDDSGLRLQRRTAAGAITPQAAPLLTPPLQSTGFGPRLVPLSDGALVRLRTRGPELELDLLEDGRLLWSQSLGTRLTLWLQEPLSDPAASRICVVVTPLDSPESVELRCRARADGAALPSIIWPGAGRSDSLLGAQLGPSGGASVFGLQSSASGSAIRLHEWRASSEGSGTLRSETRIRHVSNQALCAGKTLAMREGAGGALMEWADGRFRLHRFDADGRQLWQSSVPDAWRCAGVVAVSAEGEVLIAEFDPRAPQRLPEAFLAFSGQGSVYWHLSAEDVLGTMAASPPEQSSSMRWFKPRAADAWLVDLRSDALRALAVVDAASGARRALLRTPSEWPEATPWEFAAEAMDGQVSLFQRGVERMLAHTLALADGRLGPPNELRAHGYRQPASAIVVGQRLLSPLFAEEQAEPLAMRSLDSPPLANDRPLGPEHSGLWFDPLVTGQGLVIDVEAARQRWFAAWFSFAEPAAGGGLAGPAPRLRQRLRWYSMLGQADSASGIPIAGRLYMTRGGRFDGGAPITVEAGQAFLRAIDCNTLEFAYAIPDPDDAAAPVLTGTRRLQRLGPAPAACGGASLAEQSGLRAASTGSWVLEGRPNQGLLMQVDPGVAGQAGALWGAWFGFDAGEPDDALAQHWLTVIGRSATGQAGVVELEWMRTLGGSFDAQPTRNTRVIGTGRLRFSACDRAVLEYSFDAPGLPGDAFAGLQGQVNLRRFESCQ